PSGRQIPLSDLTVSVVGDRIVLKSVRFGREVIPRLTNAHNYATGRGIYQFLCALQQQGVAAEVHWDWGPLSASTFLPRVTCGRRVRARAGWLVSPAEAGSLTAGNADQRFRAVQNWRRERNLPRWVCISELDHELPIDLDDRLMVDVLLEESHPDRS